MVLRIGIAVVLGLVALAVAFVAQRRSQSGSGSAQPVTTGRDAPGQLHRADFARPDAEWLVVLFSSASCGGCADMAAKVAVLASDAVATAEIEYGQHRDLHERYAIDAVPLVVIADKRGVVRRSFFGSTSATDLWAALALLRTP